jgi:H+/Cl- antiporter ClcA
VIESTQPEGGSRLLRLGMSACGGLVGGLAGAATAVIVTEMIKRILAIVSRQDIGGLVVLPLVGLMLAVVILQGYHRGEALQTLSQESSRPRSRRRWSLDAMSPRDVIRADLTADVLATAGEEERFPWRLAPIRALAIVATVGLGAPMGTESPAAHLGVSAGVWLADRGRWWRRLARPAGVGGGAAGVSALVGIPLVGTAFILELGRRRRVPLSAERVTAALMGGIVGWVINVAFDLNLIRLNVPETAPGDLLAALGTALLAGVLAGTITSLTGIAIYWARGWQQNFPIVRLVLGGAVVATTTIVVATLAVPPAAVGPGAAAAVWAEVTDAGAFTLVAVAVLRAVGTTAAVVAGGCGGVFVPFLAIGDIAGRAFAPAFGVPSDLAGAAGAAGGIAGGYRLPFTAAMLVLGLGGPYAATITCLATVGVATMAGVGAALAVDRLASLRLVPMVVKA